MPTASRAHYVSQNLRRSRHAPQLPAASPTGGWRNYLSNWLAEAGDANWFAGLAYLFEDAKAFSLEFRDGDFFHSSSYTMVNDHGQYGVRIILLCSGAM